MFTSRDLLMIGLFGAWLAAQGCTEVPTPPKPPETGATIQRTLEITRLACVAYVMQRELGTHEVLPDAEAVCPLLLKGGGDAGT